MLKRTRFSTTFTWLPAWRSFNILVVQNNTSPVLKSNNCNMQNVILVICQIHTSKRFSFFLSSSSPYSPSAFSTGLIRGFHWDSHTIAHLHFCFHSYELTPSYVRDNNHIHEIAADKSFFMRNSSTEPQQWLPTDFHQLPTVGGCRCIHNNWSMLL
jgi:hypothetical protein